MNDRLVSPNLLVAMGQRLARTAAANGRFFGSTGFCAINGSISIVSPNPKSVEY